MRFGQLMRHPVGFTLYAICVGAIGGIILGFWLGGNLDHGGRFTPIDEWRVLRAIADRIGVKATFVLICAVAMAGGAVVIGWRVRQAGVTKY